MSRKHWHLTSEPLNRAEYGGRISIRSYADELAKWARRRSGRPIYVDTCRDETCGPAGQGTVVRGRPLIEVLADDD